MQKKCVIFYLGKVPSYFFILKRDFHYVGMTDQKNNTSPKDLLFEDMLAFLCGNAGIDL
jgi:hypothetical protein